MPRFLLRAFCLVMSLQGVPWYAKAKILCLLSFLSGHESHYGGPPYYLITSLRPLPPRPFKLVIKVSTTELAEAGVVGAWSTNMPSIINGKIPSDFSLLHSLLSNF